MSTEQMTEQKTEQNRSETFRAIANLLNLSTYKYPPLRNWRTGDTTEEKFNYARFWACVSILALTVAAITAVCVWLW